MIIIVFQFQNNYITTKTGDNAPVFLVNGYSLSVKSEE